MADDSQAALLERLDELGVTYESFWVVNAVEITADEAVLAEVAARPEVEEIVADPVYELPEPLPGAEEATVQAVEWNIDRIGAPLVWSTLGVRGEGIVVASIDSGVQFDHPALFASTGAISAVATLDHDYNWFDPSQVCGNPSLAPCDNNGHGTHTMGTMVGDDGDPGANQIGVAPTPAGSRRRVARRTLAHLPRCWPPASGCWPRRISPERTRGPICGRTSSTTRGAARAAIRSTRRPSTHGSPPASSRRSRTATAGPTAARRLAWGLREHLQRRRLRHQQQHRQLLEPGSVAVRRRGEAEHRRARCQRAQRPAEQHVRLGRAARRWPHRTSPGRWR